MWGAETTADLPHTASHLGREGPDPLTKAYLLLRGLQYTAIQDTNLVGFSPQQHIQKQEVKNLRALKAAHFHMLHKSHYFPPHCVCT